MTIPENSREADEQTADLLDAIARHAYAADWMNRTHRAPLFLRIWEALLRGGPPVRPAALELADWEAARDAELEMVRLMRCLRVCVALWWSCPERWGVAAQLLADGFLGSDRDLMIVVDGIVGTESPS
ncbi:MAG: hypothetical protein QOG19_3059 [Mycobacterium sp.]|jgi:hypothetical protein|nr:hypothetical protein [Mycobacterium sp.]